MSKHAREKCRILCISSILSSKRGITPSKIDANWQHSNLICRTAKQSHAKCQLNMSKHVREKCRKLRISSFLSSKRGITPTKKLCKLTTLELDLYYNKTKSYANFQLNMSKHAREKCGILCISSILSSKRGITPTKIDASWWHSNMICSTGTQSHAKFQLNM